MEKAEQLSSWCCTSYMESFTFGEHCSRDQSDLLQCYMTYAWIYSIHNLSAAFLLPVYSLIRANSHRFPLAQHLFCGILCGIMLNGNIWLSYHTDPPSSMTSLWIVLKCFYLFLSDIPHCWGSVLGGCTHKTSAYPKYDILLKAAVQFYSLASLCSTILFL